MISVHVDVCDLVVLVALFFSSIITLKQLSEIN